MCKKNNNIFFFFSYYYYTIPLVVMHTHMLYRIAGYFYGTNVLQLYMYTTFVPTLFTNLNYFVIGVQ